MTEPKAVQEIKDTVVAVAARAVGDALTPQMLRRCIEEILEDVLSSITSDQYGALGRKIREEAERVLVDFLKTDDAKMAINRAVRNGVAMATERLDEAVKGKITDAALKGVYDALIPVKRY